jgi:hypothetical protein
MRQNWLSNRVFKSYDDIVDHCCYAWNTLIAQPWRSCQSGSAIGPTSVDQFEDRYKSLILLLTFAPVVPLRSTRPTPSNSSRSMVERGTPT